MPGDNCAKINENAKLRRVATCIVSYLDTSGLRHSVEVVAGSLFEAAALAISVFRQHECEPGAGANLEVEIRSSVTHTVTPARIHEWLSGGAKSPAEFIIKERLRRFLT